MLISFPVEWLFEEIKLDQRVAEGMPDQSVEDVTVVAALRSALRGRLSDSDLGANRVAGLLGLDPDRLTKALRRHGTTLPKEIKRLKIDDAKTQLVEGTSSVAQIGLSLGYSDNSHFTRFFRSQTGVSPNAYRQQSRESSRT